MKSRKLRAAIHRLLVGGYYAAAAVTTPAIAAELPVPCAGSCGSSAEAWVTSGAATAVQQGNSLNINQTSRNAVLNWQSFNISADGTVQFNQPDATSVALNRIFQSDPSRIFGSLNANGRVYLVNQNGILFGEGAKVNVGALVASTLDIDKDVVERGLVANPGRPAFQQFTYTDPDTHVTTTLESQPLIVERGARLFADGGQIFLFAPAVENRGRIETPDGQTILAAGQEIFLSQAGQNSGLRGILVAVNRGGTVENGDAEANAAVTDPSQLVGQILAERGNITLAGMAVNQNGRVSASTSVRANGSVRLIAAQRGVEAAERGENAGGQLTLGARSRTEVLLDDDDESATVDVNDQPRSNILLAGNRITLERNSAVVAPGGNINVRASNEGAEIINVGGDPVIEPRRDVPPSEDPENPPTDTPRPSRVFIDRDAVLDVSGVHTTASMESNVLTVELRGSQLADSPDQRNGALRGQRVQIDVRRSGTREDGSTWYGSAIGDLNPDVATRSRTVAERNLAGGTVEIASQGDIIVAGGARVDVSGGSIRYNDGYVTTSALLGADGRIYDIGDADPLQEYVGVLSGSSYARKHDRWGVTEQFFGTFAGGSGRFEQGYIEGKDAGTLSLLAPNVIFDGQLVANRVVGPNQRLPSTTTFTSGLYRPFDQLPVGGELLLGRATGPDNRFVVTDVSISAGQILPGLLSDNGLPFDPLRDALPTAVDSVRLRPELFGEGAATRVSIRSDRSVTMSEQTHLNLPALSRVSITARDIDFAGTIASPGGTVELQARRTTTQLDFGQGELRFRDSARLDLAGTWVNESELVNPGRSTEALAINGGRATLTGIDSNVVIEAGSVIDVSGGARANHSGRVTGGTGGTISLTASSSAGFADQSPVLEVNGDLRGFALSQGGTLSLSAGAVCIAGVLDVCGTDVSENALLVTPERLRSGGFSSYSVTANRRGLTVGANTEVILQQENLVLSDAALSTASASSLAGLATATLLDGSLRRPTNLSLSARYQQADGETANAANYANLSVLSMQRGSSILADPGARVSLTSNTGLYVDGTIAAPAGQISLNLTEELVLTEYLPGQSIWLGGHASLSAAGTVRYRPNDLGLLDADVLAGGIISLNARRGYIAANPSSRLDVSGASGAVDILLTPGADTPAYERRTVASRAGEMHFTAAEGIFLSGDLEAHSGDPATLMGGSLYFALDANGRYERSGSDLQPPIFPEDPRRIEIATSAPSVAFGPGAPLPAESIGPTILSAEMIDAAGFDNLTVESRTRNQVGQVFPPLPGEVRLGSGLDLSLRGSLSIDSAAIVSTGGDSRLSATVISLGQRSTVRQEVPTVLASGEGTVELNAQLIDLVGHSVFSGFSEVALRSSGDIRARGVQLNQAKTLDGSLRTTGELTLQAQQVYPTTLSQFAFIADEPEAGTITVKASGSRSASPVYSAGGNLTLRAPTINQGGTLRAPFGTISLEADRLSLLGGSTTSTSAAGLVIPFGETQGGFDWVYQLGTQTLVFDADAPPPAQSVRLTGESVDIQSGATVDVRGGGDLVAYEFVPGVGGTKDVLDATIRPDAFSIVPASALAFAPHDVAMYEGSSISPGDTIHLDGGAGVPAGDYVILPARYALLPGALYVRPVDGFQDLTARDSGVLPDGSTLVSGYRTFGGTGLRYDGRSSGFSVRPGSEILREAQYTSTRANTFFTAQAADAEVALARMPRDAGTLSITAGERLNLSGNLLGSADTDGRGTSLDISSDSLRLVNGSDAPVLEGVVNLDAQALNRFGAESILLGGTRLQTADGLKITTRARSVEVAEGASVVAPELILAGTESVIVREGAELRGQGTVRGAATTDLLFNGDGAMLRVTSGQDAVVQRTNSAGGHAMLNVEQGALLSARGGAVAAESAGTAQFAPTLDVAGGVLALTGDRISLGDVSTVESGLTLSNAQLAALTLDNLVLSSRSSIDFYGALTVTSDQLTLRSGALRGFGQGTMRAAATGTLTVEGASAATNQVAGAGTGTLLLEAQDVVLGQGSSTITGFGNVQMLASRSIEMQDKGALNVVGNVTLAAPLLTAMSGAEREIDVQGAFSYVTNGTAAPSNTDAALGARVSVNADSILFGGRADLHSGVLSLSADSGSVELTAATDLRMNGVTTTFDSVPVGSRGGWLTLDSRTGNAVVADGASINLASASTAAADRGAFTVRAVQGNADIRGNLTGGGADFLADANQIVDFGALNVRLSAGDFSGDRGVRQRGAGTLVVGTSERIDARSVNLVADRGGIVVNGAVRSHADGGGSITLSSRNGIAINGTLDASGANDSERNGQIELGTTQGPIRVASNARIIGTTGVGANKSFADGTLHIRAPRSLLATLTDTDAANNGLVLAGDLTRVNAVTIEGFATYNDSDGVITADQTAAVAGNVMFDEATAFAAQSDAILRGLGTVRGPTAQVLAGIEIFSANDLELQSDWSLNDWRFNGLPGYLTLRASGNLTFNASLSDGFASASPLALGVADAGPSWSYRLVAGADRTSADPLAVRPASTLGVADHGTLRVAEGAETTNPTVTDFRMIRTGTGSIDIAAARNVELGNQTSVIYTAGMATEGVSFDRNVDRNGNLGGRMYPDRGGDIRIAAGEDVIGAPTNQLVTDWLWRVGRDDTDVASSRAPAWTVNFSRFMQNVGTLGGGNLSVRAGGDIRDLSAVAPTIGRQVGGTTLPESNLEIVAGGNLDVRAEGAIEGGVFYAGRGSLDVIAGDTIGNSARTKLAPIIALGDTQAHVSSRADLAISNVVNPTLLRMATSQSGNQLSFFSTYTPDSAVSFANASGDLKLLNSDLSAFPTEGSVLQSMGIFNETNGEQLALLLYPSAVTAAALRGNVEVADSFTLFPADRGGLQLFADRNVLFNGADVQVILSDADPAYLPSLTTPQRTADRLGSETVGALRATQRGLPAGESSRFFHATTPERLRDGREDFTPSRIVARTEDVRMEGAGGGTSTSGLYLAEPTHVVAGRDISGLSVTAQNLEAGDVSVLSAGRDIIYPLLRDDAGAIRAINADIAVDGPGTLLIRTGRDLNLQTSAGISSFGNTRNPGLAGSGADISVQAGTAGHEPDYVAFIDKYLVGAEFAKKYAESSKEYRDGLVAYMRARGSKPANFDEALQAFRQLSISEQAPLLERMLFSELRASGRAAAQPGETNKDFTRGFAALTTYFPGSNPDLDAGERNPYNGDIQLYFSKIYTLDDGDIRLLAPGGEINVGLASPPSAFNLNKAAADLGVVAQRSGSVSALSFYDFLVNESRVFAADGGNILVWATQGDIDAGRGAKTAISAPPPTITFDPQTGAPIVTFPPALTGSGIQTLATSEGRKPGNVDLFAPRGVVNAGDAGIVAGNLTIAATAVLGADNIQVSGVAVGVPVDTGGLGASLAGVSSVGSSANSAAAMAVDPDAEKQEKPQSLADSAMSWLEVFVVGLGEEQCNPKDMECLKRQSTTN